MARVAKTFAGARLRRLREEHGLTQVAFARALGLSTSYVNQLENDQRPITVAVLLTLTERFDLPTQYFAPDSDARLVSDLREVLAEGNATAAQIEELVARMPDVGQTLVNLHRRLHDATADLEALHSRANLDISETSAVAQQPMPFEEVRDFFYDRKNYIGELDTAAEELFNRNRLRVGGLDGQLAQLLADKLGVTVVIDDGQTLNPNAKRLFQPESKTLYLARWLYPGQRAFQIATQIALLTQAELIAGIIAGDDQLSDDARGVARIGLANYFAGALLLPYRRFLPPKASAMTSINWPAGLRWASKPSATGCPPCNAPVRAEFRSFSFAPTAREISLNASPPRRFTSLASGGTAPYGWFTTPRPVPANSSHRLLRCPTNAPTSGSREPPRRNRATTLARTRPSRSGSDATWLTPRS